jgi:type II secretory ATPase GspE/PulE/Tfp pilus assembly ATPase PilB-like protein
MTVTEFAQLTRPLEWPLPPYAVLEGALPEPACEAWLKDGKRLRGELLALHFEAGMVEIMIGKGAATPTSISFGSLKHLQLTNPVVLRSGTTVVQENDGIYAAPELRELRVEFVDGESLTGKTFGMLETAGGIFLYLDNGDQRYLRSFVPSGSIRQHWIGEPIGKMLVDLLAVTSEQVAAGLDQQQRLRNRPLGEYLKSQAVVSPEELENVLRGMRQQPSLRLGEALIQAGAIDESQLEMALEQQKHDRKRALGEILVDMGVVDRATVNALLARKIGIPYVSLLNFNIDPAVVRLVPEKLASKYHLIPLCLVDNRIFVAMENPLQNDALNEVRFHAKKSVEPVMASLQEIQDAIRRLYGSADFGDLASELAVALEGGEEDVGETEPSETDTMLTRLVNKTILDAHQQGASDIHIETYPGRKNTVIRLRRDGQMVHYLDLPANFRNAVISRIKIMASLDISERRRAQDGKIDFSHFGPARIELRVATIPTANGLEDVVLRLLNTGKLRPLDEISLSSDNLAHIQAMANRPHGILLVCGPTGSGKTTTLHSVLSYINTPQRKIWTAEDPIEITQDGLRQVQVHPKIGWTFATAMRSFLRADPDVIMVGEMRDHETSQIAIEASLTGHLVLSTLHTNSAAESVVRLLELGMDPFNFSDALLGVLSQRLVRGLCPACKKPHVASEEEIEALLQEYCDSYAQVDYPAPDRVMLRKEWQQKYASDKGHFVLYQPVGCRECDNSGYKSRLGLHELLRNTHQIKHLIQLRAPVSKIQEAAFADGMRTLKQDGIEKVLAGLTDIHMVRMAC